jgi:hypothetical protein
VAARRRLSASTVGSRLVCLDSTSRFMNGSSWDLRALRGIFVPFVNLRGPSCLTFVPFVNLRALRV